MSKWTVFATNHFKQQRKINPSYKFGQALKDAGKLYRKSVGTLSKTISKVLPKNKSRKTRRHKRK
jgi:hypothetical protein